MSVADDHCTNLDGQYHLPLLSISTRVTTCHSFTSATLASLPSPQASRHTPQHRDFAPSVPSA